MFSGSKAPKTCPGCEARADEIGNLRAQVAWLTNQLLIAAGKPEAVVESPGTVEVDADDEKPEPTADPMFEAVAHLNDLATARGRKPTEYADA